MVFQTQHTVWVCVLAKQFNMGTCIYLIIFHDAVSGILLTRTIKTNFLAQARILQIVLSGLGLISVLCGSVRCITSFHHLVEGMARFSDIHCRTTRS